MDPHRETPSSDPIHDRETLDERPAAVAAPGGHDRDGERKVRTEHEHDGDKDARTGDSLGDVLKHDWEQTKSDLPGLHGEDTGQSIGDTLKGNVRKD